MGVEVESALQVSTESPIESVGAAVAAGAVVSSSALIVLNIHDAARQG
jgi:hypothetical protein